MKLLKSFSIVEPRLDTYLATVKNYLFLRNKFVHNDGAFKETAVGGKEFIEFASKRKDVSITILKGTDERFTHQISVKQSSLLIEYVEIIKQIFQLLIQKANNLPYIN
jgi:hypothetical protein